MTFDMCEELSKSSATLPLKSKHQAWFKIGPSTPFEIALQLWTASSVAQSAEGLVWPLTGAHLQWSFLATTTVFTVTANGQNTPEHVAF